MYALSRRPPEGDWPAHFQHISVDFLNGGAEGIAKALKDNNVKPDVAFFYAYIQPAPKDGGGIWSNIQELVRVNSTIPPSPPFFVYSVYRDWLPGREPANVLISR